MPQIIKIVSEHYMIDVEREVNELLDEGWTLKDELKVNFCYGSNFSAHLYTQVMTKNIAKSTNKDEYPSHI